MADSRHIGLILGGARSGKSRHGESLARSGGSPCVYIATAEAGDAEMAERIARHRARRGADWTTIEAPHDLPGAITAEAEGTRALLVDCVTLWLSNRVLAGADPESETDALLAALERARGRLVLVSNEVGLGIVPHNALARRFRDAQGLCNQRIAALADHVVLMAAGLPLVLKGGAPR